jgi:regulator of cell morphogenesis and NO signaling
MSQVSLDATVGDLVVEQPSRSRVFSKLGIDFCCGGKKTLAQVCREKSLEPDTVLSLLVTAPPAPRSEWAEAPLASLTEHIVRTHHDHTRAELGRLSQMLDKVARVHGDNHPFMIEVASVFHGFADDLLAHMVKEERVLFPAIAALASGAGGVNVTTPIRVMNGEHDQAAPSCRECAA